MPAPDSRRGLDEAIGLTRSLPPDSRPLNPAAALADPAAATPWSLPFVHKRAPQATNRRQGEAQGRHGEAGERQGGGGGGGQLWAKRVVGRAKVTATLATRAQVMPTPTGTQ